LADNKTVKCNAVIFSVCALFLLTECNGYFTPTQPTATLPSEWCLYQGAFSMTELLSSDSSSTGSSASQTVLLEQQLIDTSQSLASLRPDDSSYSHSLVALSAHPSLRLVPESFKTLQLTQTAVLQTFAPGLIPTFNASQLDSLRFKGFPTNGALKAYTKQLLHSIVQPSIIRSGEVMLHAENTLNIPLNFKVNLYTGSVKHLTHSFVLAVDGKDSISYTFDETLVGSECYLEIEEVSAPEATEKVFIDNTTAALLLEQRFTGLRASSGYFYAADTVLVRDTVALALPVAHVDGLTSVDLASLKVETSQSLDSLGEVVHFQGNLWHGNQLLSTQSTQLVPGSAPFYSTLSTGHRGYATSGTPLEYRYEVRVDSTFPTLWSDASNLLLQMNVKSGAVTAVEYNTPQTVTLQKGFVPTPPFWATTAVGNSGQELATLNGELAVNAWGKAVLSQSYTAQNDQGTYNLQDTAQLTFAATQKSDSATRSTLQWGISASDDPDLGPIASVNNSYQYVSLDLTFQPPFGVIFSTPLSSSVSTSYPLSSFTGELVLRGSHTLDFNGNGMDSLGYLSDSISLRTVLRCVSSSDLDLSYALEAFGDTLSYLRMNALKDSLFVADSAATVYDLGLLQVPFTGTFNGTFDDTLLLRTTDSLYIDVLGTYHYAL